MLGWPPAGAPLPTRNHTPLPIFGVSSEPTCRSIGPIYSSYLVLAKVSLAYTHTKNVASIWIRPGHFKQYSKQDPRTERKVPVSLTSSPQQSGLASRVCAVSSLKLEMMLIEHSAFLNLTLDGFTGSFNCIHLAFSTVYFYTSTCFEKDGRQMQALLVKIPNSAQCN